MAGPLPHSAQFAKWTNAYLVDTENAIRSAIASLKTSVDFRAIYQNSFAAEAVLGRLCTSRWRPPGHGIRCLLLRIPLLVATRQISSAIVELRRLTEMTFWVCYFTDHPVEWREFESNPASGFHPAIDQPIRYCAHRGIKFYMDYTAERLAADPSNLGIESVQDLRNLVNELNSVVHPAHLSAAQRRPPPFEDISSTSLVKFSDLQHRVFAAVVIILSAVFRKQFDVLPAMHRAQFDWLIGTKRAKRLRSGSFGLL